MPIERSTVEQEKRALSRLSPRGPFLRPERWMLIWADAASRFAQRLEQQGMEEPAEIIDMLPPQETRPSFSDLFAAADGNLWVRLVGPKFPGSHVVFDGSGTYAGHVDVPDHERILDIRYGLIVVLEKNELGVETISVHRLTRLR